MSVILGSKNVSSEQQHYLELARSGPPSSVYRAFQRVSSDPDILSGREELHPDWLELFRAYGSDLTSRYLGPEPSAHKQVTDFFEPLVRIDSGIADLDPSAKRITFLLGAGASKPEPSGIPTVKELLPDLLTRARRLDREDVTMLADFCDEIGIDNIEDLLTAAQLAEFSSRNLSVLRLLDFLVYKRSMGDERSSSRSRRLPVNLSSVAFLQDTLQVLFGLLSSRMLPAKPNKGHLAIAEYVKCRPGASIVTTNYDCCIDLALGVEGKDFSYRAEFSNSKKKNVDLVSLVKLHGSLNWFYCETCQDVQLIDIAATVKSYLSGRSTYPVIAVCRGCGGQRRGLLVPPLAMKFDVAPPLNPLLEEAGRLFACADVVAVVGFSFADADLYISRMLSKWMQRSATAQLVIFDPDTLVVQKVRRQFAVRIPGFDVSRILSVRGDCSEMLPEFLAGRLVREGRDSPSAKGGSSSGVRGGRRKAV